MSLEDLVKTTEIFRNKELEKKLKQMPSIVIEARKFATEKHGDQKYGDNEPYVTHLDKVSEVLISYGYNYELWSHLHVVAYLHDVLEDTKCTQHEIAEKFGTMVLEDVFRLTNENGKNRREKHLITYAKLRESWSSRLVKLCDRLSNTKESYYNTMFKPKTDKIRSLYEMYKKEYPEFYKNLYFNQDNLNKLWDSLTSYLGTYIVEDQVKKLED